MTKAPRVNPNNSATYWERTEGARHVDQKTDEKCGLKTRHVDQKNDEICELRTSNYCQHITKIHEDVRRLCFM